MSLQASASAPLLQGVKKAVRVSVIAMGPAPLAPKEPEQAPEKASALTEEKVQCCLRYPTTGYMVPKTPPEECVRYIKPH